MMILSFDWAQKLEPAVAVLSGWQHPAFATSPQTYLASWGSPPLFLMVPIQLVESLPFEVESACLTNNPTELVISRLLL